MSRFITGLAIGVVAGLLLAPDKGTVTREHLAAAADKWKQKMDKMMGKTAAHLEDLRAYIETNVEGLEDDVKKKLLSIMDDAEKKAAKLKNLS